MSMSLAASGALIKGLGTVGGFAAEELSAAGQANRAQIKKIQDKLERGESLGFSEEEKKAMLTQLSRQLRSEDKGTESELVRGAQSGPRSGNIVKALSELVGRRHSAMAEGYGDIAEASALQASETYKDHLDRVQEQADKWGDLGKELATVAGGGLVQGINYLGDKKTAGADLAEGDPPTYQSDVTKAYTDATGGGAPKFAWEK